ncbi:MAG: dual specificity protein phosphatase family protein, partial [Ignavibacteriae bacterium]|nr:dual specificity protein phosphatase family protein [Ignavibacteriota bacterium]
MKLLDTIQQNFFKLTVKIIFLFSFVWFMVGFVLGTATLMGPVRWITNVLRSSSVDSSVENLLVNIVILLFVIISFILSLNIVKWFNNSSTLVKKVLLLGIPFLLSILTMWLWFSPRIMQFNSIESTESFANIEFIFGAYPDETKMFELKNQNITGIISLLHEAVVPFEPKFLADEIELTNKLGLELIHLPMLPWVSENENSLAEISKIAREGNGKYYVHCYLGKDRVGVVRRVIKDILGEEKISGNVNQRKIDDFQNFERGKIIKLDEGVYLTPFPTDEEFFAFILNGSFKNVVSFLTKNIPDDVQWIEKEERILKAHNINYHYMPIDLKP